MKAKRVRAGQVIKVKGKEHLLMAASSFVNMPTNEKPDEKR